MAKVFKVTFEMLYEGDEENIKKVIDHHIDRLIDLDSWPEIKEIYNAQIEEE
jgi:hypothetical protein